jgi:adenine-specific DNA-methyltransferase
VVSQSLFEELERDVQVVPGDQMQTCVRAGVVEVKADHLSNFTSGGPELTEMGCMDAVRLEANVQLSPARKVEFGQFMTPDSVARFMASLFSRRLGEVRLLDAGAGIGSLTAAFLANWQDHPVHVSAYEIDLSMLAHLRQTLGRYVEQRSASIVERDFIQHGVFQLKLGKRSQGFTHAILNPPYKKINNDSEHRALLKAIGLETVNLYTGFVGVALEMMEKGGEIVAIIPRSFCNGLYYKPFREWIFERSSIEQIHLFHSRTSAFQDDKVLQENVIIKLVRGKKQGKVTVTTSSDKSFVDLVSNEYDFAEIVKSNDQQKFIHIPSTPLHPDLDGVPLAKRSLDEIGLQVSTGPVVDFRLKQFLRQDPESGAVPLLYSNHFSKGSLEWPRQSKKPNAIVSNAETKKWLYPNGSYTVVRRFSSKEERRRIVAHVVEPEVFTTADIGFENHLNVFHSGKQGIDPVLAHGLAVFLNSTAVDDYFRRFSGHTQVNATDLRLLRYPDLADLLHLGKWSKAKGQLTQQLIDEKVEAVDGSTK